MMITVYKHQDLGHVRTDWLDSRHHFSFGHYRNPERMNFGNLRVINDDVIRAGSGFGLHPHRNMEIITYVRNGRILHKDSMNNQGSTIAGDVQVMSAGRGIAHSEYADKDAGEDTVIYQIWIEPKEKGIDPRWDSAEFPKKPIKNSDLPLLVSGFEEDQGKDALYIHQDAAIFGGRMERGVTLTHVPRTDKIYALVSSGDIEINGETMAHGDGAEIEGRDDIVINALSDSEILLIEV